MFGSSRALALLDWPPSWLLTTGMFRGPSQQGLPVGGLQGPRPGLAHTDSAPRGSVHCTQVIACSVYMHRLLSWAGCPDLAGEIPVSQPFCAYAASVYLLLYG